MGAEHFDADLKFPTNTDPNTSQVMRKIEEILGHKNRQITALANIFYPTVRVISSVYKFWRQFCDSGKEISL